MLSALYTRKPRKGKSMEKEKILCECGLDWPSSQKRRAFGPKYSDLSAKQRRRANVRSHANVAQRRGQLRKEPCQSCGSTSAVEKHHESYRRALDVKWLCRKCHL